MLNIHKQLIISIKQDIYLFILCVSPPFELINKHYMAINTGFCSFRPPHYHS